MSPRKSKPPGNISEVLLSGRSTPRIDALYALIVTDEYGVESIVRRSTPMGAIPLLTDDARLVDSMLELARSTAPETHFAVATFVRAADYRTVTREGQ